MKAPASGKNGKAAEPKRDQKGVPELYGTG